MTEGAVGVPVRHGQDEGLAASQAIHTAEANHLPALGASFGMIQAEREPDFCVRNRHPDPGLAVGTHVLTR